MRWSVCDSGIWEMQRAREMSDQYSKLCRNKMFLKSHKSNFTQVCLGRYLLHLSSVSHRAWLLVLTKLSSQLGNSVSRRSSQTFVTQKEARASLNIKYIHAILHAVSNLKHSNAQFQADPITVGWWLPFLVLKSICNCAWIFWCCS